MAYASPIHNNLESLRLTFPLTFYPSTINISLRVTAAILFQTRNMILLFQLLEIEPLHMKSHYYLIIRKGRYCRP
jgi:hypothetical protein